MTINGIVNQLTEVQQRLDTAPFTRDLERKLELIFNQAMSAAISDQDRTKIFYSLGNPEAIGEVIQILSPYCWQNECKESETKRQRTDDKVVKTFTYPNSNLKINLVIRKRSSEQTSTPKVSEVRTPRTQMQAINTHTNYGPNLTVHHLATSDARHSARGEPEVRTPRPRQKTLNTHTYYGSNLTVRKMVKIDSETANKTAAILNTPNAFKKEPKRDKKYELRDGQSISQVQGSSSFCQKVVEHMETPSVLSPAYLRSQRKVNEVVSLALMYKRVGHTFDLKGMVKLPDNTQVSLEGFSESFVSLMEREAFHEFASLHKDLISQEMHDWVDEALSQAIWHDNISNERIENAHRRIHDLNYPYPVVVSSGWVWHSTRMIFMKLHGKLYGLYCNCGADCDLKPGIRVLAINNSQKITPEFLRRIASRLTVDYPQYTSLEKMKVELSAYEIGYVPMKPQDVGNCVHASENAEFLALFMIWLGRQGSIMDPLFTIHNIHRATQIHWKFQQFREERVLEDFLIDLEDVKAERVFMGKGHQNYLEGLHAVASRIKAWALQHRGLNRISNDLVEKTLKLTDNLKPL
jgi:hypothetical protein